MPCQRVWARGKQWPGWQAARVLIICSMSVRSSRRLTSTAHCRELVLNYPSPTHMHKKVVACNQL